MKRFLIPIGIITSIVLIVLSGVLGYLSVNSSFAISAFLPSVQQATPTPPVRTTRVTRGDVRQVLTVPGDVTPANTQSLSFSAGGRLIELNVRAGDQVTQGKVLASIDEAPLKLALAQAQVDYRIKQDALDKIKASSVITTTDVKQAEISAQSAASTLRQAQADLTGAVMLAPFSGRVLSVTGNVRDTIAANATVVEMADLSQLEIQTSIGQQDVTAVQAGQSATITFDARPGETFSGKVSRVVPKKASTSGAVTYTVFVSVDKAPQGLLPGMTADADIIVAERKNVLTLPRRSIRATANATINLSVIQNGQTTSKSVKVGLVGDLNVEILSGLQEGDQVVTTQ
ncbi:Macrolide export protein MacA [Anaerolineae bacterium]|nr:Macrolide export protein MacA [Anaerolineae bacterium]